MGMLKTLVVSDENWALRFLWFWYVENNTTVINYINLVWSNDNVCGLCPLNKHVIVAKIFVHISRDVLPEQKISLIHSKAGFTSKVTVCIGGEGLSLNIPFKSY